MKQLAEQFHSVESLLHLSAKMERLTYPQQHFVTVMENAMNRSLMIALLARGGSGKTSAVAWFKQFRRHVVYIRPGPSYTVRSLLDDVILQLKGEYPQAHADSLFIKVKEISRYLVRDNEKKMIIIDEAGKLSARTVSIFQEIRDNTMESCAMAFVGVDYFRKNLVKEIDRGTRGIAEFYRRIQRWYSMPSFNLIRDGPDYLKSKGLSESMTGYILKNHLNIETIAELEIISDILLENKDSFETEEIKQMLAPIAATPMNTRPVVAKKSKSKRTVDDDYDI